MTDKPAPATDEEIKRAEMDWDFWSRDSFRSSMIARIRAEQERVRVLMSDTLTYRERIRELEAEVAALKATSHPCMQHANESAELRAEVARLRELMVRYVRAEDALSHFLEQDDCDDQVGVEADLAEEETDALEAIRAFARAALGESKG